MATKDISDLQVCQAYAKWQLLRDMEHVLLRQGATVYLEIGWPYDLLMAATGQCFKVCCRAMERAARRDLVEYGVSLRTGWLTDKGRALLG